MNKLTDLEKKERARQELLRNYNLDAESISETHKRIQKTTEEESEKLGKELYSIIIKKKYDDEKDYEQVEQLIYQGANVNYKNSKQGNFPLYFCCRKGAIKTFSLLIRAGANINQVNDYKTSCCMASARHNNYEILKILIALGADINARCLDGENAIISAKRHDCVESFNILKEAQAYLNAKSLVGHSIFNLDYDDDTVVTINPSGLILEESYSEESLCSIKNSDIEDVIFEASEKLEAFTSFLPSKQENETTSHAKILTKNQTK